MIQLSSTRMGQSFHRKVATGTVIEQEGMALCYTQESGETVVSPSTAGTSQTFAGLALSRNTALTRAVDVVAANIPDASAYTVTLLNTPLSGEYRVTYANGTAFTEGVVAAGVFSISGSTFTFDAADADEAIIITYAYTPTVAQSIQHTGNGPSVLAANALSTIGIIKEGDIGTDQFDVNMDWSGGMAVKAGANGLLTSTAGTGTVIPGAVVLKAPSVGSAFLQISLR